MRWGDARGKQAVEIAKEVGQYRLRHAALLCRLACGLTLGEIERLKESFFATIRTMHHNRIAYPKPKADDATAAVIELRKAEQKQEA